MIPPVAPPSFITSSFVSMTCGQDITLSSAAIQIITIQCNIFNGSEPIIKEVLKDGVFIGNIFPWTIISFDDDDFGTYVFKASVTGCGSAIAESKILREGQ